MLTRFDSGLEVETSDLMSAHNLLAQVDGSKGWPGAERSARRLGLTEESPATIAGALEFSLEGLHLTKRLNKSETDAPATWRFETEPP